MAGWWEQWKARLTPRLAGRGGEFYVAGGLILLALIVLMIAFASGPIARARGEPTGEMSQEELFVYNLEQTLGAIAGAGQVKVMVSYARQDDVPASGTLFASSAGTTLPKIVGVIAVAEGARDISVRVALTTALTTVLGLNADQVDIFPMESKN